jgi:hypothetical protein
MLTLLVPLLLCCVVAHRAESGHQRAQHTVMMDLISIIEVSLAQLKLESNRVLESANRSASGATTHADALLPPPTLQGDTQANYSYIGTKTIPERNTLQLSDAIARNSSNGSMVVLVANYEDANASRYCIERSSSLSLSVRPCSAESTSQLWVRTPVGEVCVHDSPKRCMYYDSATSEKGLGMTSQVQYQHQR